MKPERTTRLPSSDTRYHNRLQPATAAWRGPDRRRRQKAPLGPKNRMGPNKGDSARRRSGHGAGQYWIDPALTEKDVQGLLIG